MAGAHGVEGRYPFLDPHVVQEYLWLTADLKNSEYKRPVADYLRVGAFPNHWKAKIGFTPLGQPDAETIGAPPETRKTGRRRLG